MIQQIAEEVADHTRHQTDDALSQAAWITANVFWKISDYANLMAERFATYPTVIVHENRLRWHYDLYPNRKFR